MALKLPSLWFEIGADTTKLDKAKDKVKQGAEQMTSSMSRVGTAIATAFSAGAAMQAIKIADSMRVMEGRIARLTKTTKDFNLAWDSLNKTADATGVSIQASAQIFERFLNATQGMNVSIEQVAEFNDLIQKTGVISGSSAVELQNALTQLSQGLQGGIIRAEEWNSVMEQSPEILRVAARNIKGVDGDMGKLRQAMLDGQLTSETFFNAFMAGAEDINEEFKKVPKSVEAGLQAVQNQFSRMISNIDKTYNLTKNLSGNLSDLADLFDENKRRSDALKEAETERNVKLIKLIGQRRDLEDAIAANQLANDAIEEDRNNRRLDAIKEQIKLLQHQNRIAAGIAGGFVTLPEFSGQPEETPKRGKATLGAGTPKGGSSRKTKAPDFSNIISINEDSARDLLSSIMALTNDAYDEIVRIQLDYIEQLTEARAKNLLSEQEYQDALTKVSIDAANKRAELDRQEQEQKARAAQQQVETIAGMASSMANIMESIGNNDDTFGRIASGFKGLATSIVATSQAMAAAQALADPTALTLPQKLANYGVILSSFASITGMLAGGREFGGTAHGGMIHPVNEKGVPELLEVGNKQALMMPKGVNGKITPLSGGGGGGGNSMTIQQNISVSGTGDKDLIQAMSKAARDGARLAEQAYAQQMASKSGKMYNANKQTYGSGRTTGVQ